MSPVLWNAMTCDEDGEGVMAAVGTVLLANLDRVVDEKILNAAQTIRY